MSVIEKEVSPGNRVYNQVMSLYASLRSAGQLTLRRAEMRQGEVKAEPIDFIVDVETKARRTISDDIYAWHLWCVVLQDPSRYATLPMSIREGLGLIFEVSRLGPDGDYRSLYHRQER